MPLTQMQIIQSLGESMAWFERELAWGVKPTELRHLSGRIGELYAALITHGQMALEVNQKGYDVVGGNGDRISVKTTASMESNGHVGFNANTLEQVDRIIILHINTEEMQIEMLLNVELAQARELMTEAEGNKLTISMSKLTAGDRKDLSKIKRIREVRFEDYRIEELENGTIQVHRGDELQTPARPILRGIAGRLNLSIVNSNGNELNTRQLGGQIIRALMVR